MSSTNTTNPSSSHLYLRHFTFTSAETQETKTITISENSEYLPGHGSIIWSGSVILSFHIFHSPRFMKEGLENKRVLDLGSGCGMTAMAAAMAYPNSDVTASDLPSNVNHVVRMFELNHLERANCNAKALDWTQPSQLTSIESQSTDKDVECPRQTFDTIIGCEVVYHEPILLPLLDTVDYHLKSNGLLYLVSARHRHCYLQLFYELQERGYDVVRFDTLPVPNIPSTCFDNSEKVQQELAKMRNNASVYQGEALGEITLTPSEDLSVGWFSEGEFIYDTDKLVLVTIRRR